MSDTKWHRFDEDHKPPSGVWCYVIYESGLQGEGKFDGWMFFPDGGDMYTYAKIERWRLVE